MKMDMKNRLPGVLAVINDHPVAALLKALLRSDAFGDKKQMPDQFPLGYGDAVNVGDVFFRNDERMDRRLRIDVFKSDGVVVLVNEP